MTQRPKKLRKQYVNSEHPLVMLRFEDGHEIKVYQGTGKTFDIWAGERVKILAAYDPTSNERELVENRKADDFEDAPGPEPKSGASGGADRGAGSAAD